MIPTIITERAEPVTATATNQTQTANPENSQGTSESLPDTLSAPALPPVPEGDASQGTVTNLPPPGAAIPQATKIVLSMGATLPVLTQSPVTSTNVSLPLHPTMAAAASAAPSTSPTLDHEILDAVLPPLLPACCSNYSGFDHSLAVDVLLPGATHPSATNSCLCEAATLPGFPPGQPFIPTISPSFHPTMAAAASAAPSTSPALDREILDAVLPPLLPSCYSNYSGFDHGLAMDVLPGGAHLSATNFCLPEAATLPGFPPGPPCLPPDTSALSDYDSQPEPGPNQPLSDFVLPFHEFLMDEDGREVVTVNNIVARLNSLKKIWLPFSTVPVNCLRKKHIENLKKAINKAKIEINGENYSDSTKNAINSALRQLLEFICDEFEYITDETFAKLARKLTWRTSESRAFTAPTNEQIVIMRHYLLQRHSGRGRLYEQIPIMFDLYLMFGARKGMMAKLKAGHLDFNNSRIHFTVNKQRKNKIPKTLMLLLPDHLKQLLLDFVTKFKLKPNDSLFTVKDIRHSFKSAAKAAGLGNWYHHAFRKLVATRMIEAGIAIPIIAALLGHRDCGATILKNYWEYSQNALDGAVNRYNANLNGVDFNPASDSIKLKAKLLEVVEHICDCPPEIKKAITDHLLRLESHILAGNYNQALSEISKPREAALPKNATVAVPSVPEFLTEDERSTVAQNIIYLTLKNGWGTHELEARLGLYSNAINNLRRGLGINRETLKTLAKKFKISPKYFFDPSNPRADIKLITKNLHYLADQLGGPNLPFPAATAKVLHGSELPTGKLLRRLTEELPFLTIEKLMTIDIAVDACISEAIGILARSRNEIKANIAAHIQIHYLIAGANGLALAKLTGLKSNLVHGYASARNLAPVKNREKIANALGITAEELVRPIALPNPIDCGRRITVLLAKTGLKPSTAALKMSVAYKEFLPVMQGKRLPTASQLRKMAAYFGKSAREILGLPAAQETTPSPSSTEPSAAGNPGAEGTN